MRMDFMNGNNVIHTSELLIKENIMTWSVNMIQLSNVSSVYSELEELLPFPKSGVACIAIGIVSYFMELYKLSDMFHFMAIMLIIIGISSIVAWYFANKKRGNIGYLNIIMNSGTKYRIVVEDTYFLAKIVEALGMIIMNGGIGEHKEVKVNISNSSFVGDAEILKNAKV